MPLELTSDELTRTGLPRCSISRPARSIPCAAVSMLILSLPAELCMETPGRVSSSRAWANRATSATRLQPRLPAPARPAFFMHPGEASHGDLGMITGQDVLLAVSYSGETDEVLTILPLVKRMGAKLLSMTGNPKSTLANAADVHLDVSVSEEACPLNLAPTASTTATLAMGDALAVALLKNSWVYGGRLRYVSSQRQPWENDSCCASGTSCVPAEDVPRVTPGCSMLQDGSDRDDAERSGNDGDRRRCRRSYSRHFH